MLYIILKAQLGNQLFQIFNAINLSLKYNIDYRICCDKENKTIYENKKTYFDIFLNVIKDKVVKTNKEEIEKNISNNIKYKEKSFNYDKINLENYTNLIINNIYIDGFFQSYKYFEENYNEIIELLNIKKLQNNLKIEYNYIFSKKTIGIHFRLGDYIFLQDFHPIQTIKYYIKALSELNNKLSINNDNIINYNILVFCQNIDNNIVNKYINRLNLYFQNKINFIKINDSINEWEQILFMSLCDHLIIANSTFSWFGGYFSEKENKIIIYPKKWFGKNYKDNSIVDLIPNNWIEIDD
jgi:hypothetical protein|tara:strand:- start:5482 stop:6372 length:891 start_codon:yes stop_codon:yes gene_type:complete